MGIVVKVYWPIKALTASGGAFFDLSGRGYDVEVYTTPELAQERVQSLSARGVKSGIVGGEK